MFIPGISHIKHLPPVNELGIISVEYDEIDYHAAIIPEQKWYITTEQDVRHNKKYCAWINNECAYHELTYQYKGKQYKELLVSGSTQDNTMGEGVEYFISKHKHLWESYYVKAVDYDYVTTRKITTFRDTKTAIIVHKHKTIEETTLHLHTHMELVCKQTGIRYALELPCPVGTTVDWVHPFAFLDNINKIIKQYQRHSTPFINVPHSTVAGILITILTQKGWAECRDAIKANERLQQCNKKVLIYCINYFTKQEKRIQGITTLPMLNLLADGNPTTQLIQFVQICRGEDTSIEVQHIMEFKNKKIVGKIWTDTQVEQGKHIRKMQAELKDILESLQKQNPTITSQVFSVLSMQVKQLASMSEQAKTAFAGKVYDLFGENTLTIRLSTIVTHIKTDAIDNDLLSWHMQISKEKQSFQDMKAQMAKLLGGAK